MPLDKNRTDVRNRRYLIASNPSSPQSNKSQTTKNLSLGLNLNINESGLDETAISRESAGRLTRMGQTSPWQHRRESGRRQL